MSGTKPGISVIICCYNSTGLLNDTLSHVLNQSTSPPLDWEVIIVDNNSTDNLSDWIEPVLKRSGERIIYLREDSPGLSNARIKGIRSARYNYSIFCDDDNHLSTDYFQKVYEIFENKPNIGIIGGRNLLKTDKNVTIPDWFDARKGNFAIGTQGEKSGDVTRRGFIWGAGMAIRTDILVRILNTGIRSLLSDRVGHSLSSGGDSEICLWMIMAGYRLWYEETLTLEHYIQSFRLTDQYLEQLEADDPAFAEVLFSYNTVYSFYSSISIWKKLLVLMKVPYFMLKRNKTVFMKCYIQLFTLNLIPFFPIPSKAVKAFHLIKNY